MYKDFLKKTKNLLSNALSCQSASTKLRPAVGCKVGREEHPSCAVYRCQACHALDIKVGANHGFVLLNLAPSVLGLVECSYRF